MQRDSIQNTFVVATALCLICSVLVSVFAVGLRPLQEANESIFLKQTVLKAAGLYEDGMDVSKVFDDGTVVAKIIDLESGSYYTGDKYQVEGFDQAAVARDTANSEAVANDIASIKRRENYTVAYEVLEGGHVKQLILPIRGYGLWSTLKGFLSLDVSSLESGFENVTINGIAYYEHAETPGLGGEVDNPLWKQKWVGKRAFDKDGNVVIEVAKTITDADHQVDALSGATITSDGVTNMLEYWLGGDGFGPFLTNLKSGHVTDHASSHPPKGATSNG